MNLAKTLGLAFLGSTLLFTSCKKDDASSNTPTCKVNKAYYYAPGSTTASDSALYTYNGNKVSKLTVDGDDMTFEYTGDNITKRSYIVSGSTTAEGYEQISYNSDGTISKIESFGLTTGTSYQAFERIDFTYTSGKLSKLTTYDLTNGAAEKTYEYTYTYSGNNITRVDETDYTMSTPETVSYSYSYDSNNNYYKKQNSQSLLIDPFLGGVDGAFLPIFFSANNVTALSAGGGSIPITYTLDDKQNLKDVVLVVPFAGQIKVSYTNLCQ